MAQSVSLSFKTFWIENKLKEPPHNPPPQKQHSVTMDSPLLMCEKEIDGSVGSDMYISFKIRVNWKKTQLYISHMGQNTTNCEWKKHRDPVTKTSNKA